MCSLLKDFDNVVKSRRSHYPDSWEADSYPTCKLIVPVVEKRPVDSILFQVSEFRPELNLIDCRGLVSAAVVQHPSERWETCIGIDFFFLFFECQLRSMDWYLHWQVFFIFWGVRNQTPCEIPQKPGFFLWYIDHQDHLTQGLLLWGLNSLFESFTLTLIGSVSVSIIQRTNWVMALDRRATHTPRFVIHDILLTMEGATICCMQADSVFMQLR